jgi:hypothetical protein
MLYPLRRRRRIQRSGGGIAVVSDPGTLDDLHFYYRPDTGALQSGGGLPAGFDGDPVGEWQDQSGNGFHLAVAEGFEPSWQTNEQNSLPALQFDGVDDALQVAFGSNLAQPVTYFMVCTAPASNALFDGTGAGDRIYVRRNGGNAVLGAGGTELTGPAITEGEWFILAARANGASSSVWVNETRVDAAASIGANATGGLTLGGFFDFSSPVAYKVGDFFGYAAARTNNEVLGLIRGLNQRWAIY